MDKNHLSLNSTTILDYIVIGGGIAGVQAAEVLSQFNKSFLLLEASDYLGGKIRSEKLTDLKEAQNVTWVDARRSQPSLAEDCIIEHGATYFSQEHYYSLRWCSQLKLTAFYQHYDGTLIYGKRPGEYVKYESIYHLYGTQKQEIRALISLVDQKVEEYHELVKQAAEGQNRRETRQKLSQLIKLYDSISIETYVRQNMKSKEAAELVLCMLQEEQSVACHKNPLLSLIENDSSLDDLRVYTGGAPQMLTSAFRVSGGNSRMVYGIIQVTAQRLKKPVSEFVHLSEPVLEVDNSSEANSVKVTTNKGEYSCRKVIWAVPPAVSKWIKVRNLSPQKQLYFSQQGLASALKVFVIFPTPFWRGSFNGNGVFSSAFPFHQFYDSSPLSMNCGILAFFILADRVQKWRQMFQHISDPQEKNTAHKEYMRKYIADLFFDGNLNMPILDEMVVAERTFADNQYIRNCYQSSPKLGLMSEIEEKYGKGQEVRRSEEHNLIYVCSDTAPEHPTYVEGALIHARTKLYMQLNAQDPWLDT